MNGTLSTLHTRSGHRGARRRKRTRHQGRGIVHLVLQRVHELNGSKQLLHLLFIEVVNAGYLHELLSGSVQGNYIGRAIRIGAAPAAFKLILAQVNRTLSDTVKSFDCSVRAVVRRRVTLQTWHLLPTVLLLIDNFLSTRYLVSHVAVCTLRLRG